MQKEFLNLIEKYKKEVEEIGKNLEKFNYKTVFNSDLYETNIENIKAITVMDNPGITELEQGRFLIGSAGKGFNKVINSIQNITREDNLIILNKSSIHTKATLDLNKLYQNEELKQIFLKEQELTFNFIKNIQKLCQCPIMVHGYPSYFKNEKKFIQNEKSNRPLVKFFQLLFEEYKNSPELILFYHHSSYGSLEKQFRAYEQEINDFSRTLDIFIDLGKKNSQNFFK